MAEQREFYCLRCGHRFPALHDPKTVVERSCAKCGSNSVRLAPAAPAAPAVASKSKEQIPVRPRP